MKRLYKIVALAILLAIASAAISFMFVQIGHPLAPKIWTDRLDYHPNSTVIISGSYFSPDTLVTVNVTWPDGSLHTLNNIKTSDDGNFTATHHIDVARGLYNVAATDGTYTAKTTFTDGTIGPDPNTYSHKIRACDSYSDNFISITTTNNNDVIYACFEVPSYTSGTGGISSSPSLSFTSRGSSNAGGYGDIQSWYAVANSNGTYTITFPYESSAGYVIMAFAVSGANTASPIDSALSSGAVFASNTGTSLTVSSSSTSPNDFITLCMGDRYGSSFSAGSGYNLLDSVPDSYPYTAGADEYNVSATTGFSAGLSWSGPGSPYWFAVADALVQAPVAQPITVTMSNGAPSATVTVNGGSPSPSTFASDGTSYSITMTAGASFTLSFSNAGNTRNGFSVSGFSATSSSYTASTTALSLTAYEQVQNTFSVSGVSGSDTAVLTGTYLGTSSSTIVTLSSGNSWNSQAWSDYGTVVTFPASTTASGSTERWSIGSAYSTAVLTTGGSTYSKTYYHQYKITFGYSDQDSVAITSSNKIGSYYQLGSSTAGTIYSGSSYGSTSPASDWVDAGSNTVSYQTYTATSGTERWALSSSPDNRAVSSSTTISESGYYHQYTITFGYADQDSSVITSSSQIGSYSKFGSSTTISSGSTLGSTSPTSDWVDAGSSKVSYLTFASGGQRWALSSSPASFTVSSSTTISDSSFYHEYTITFGYSTSDSSHIASALTVGSYYQFGSSQSMTSDGTGAVSPSSAWVDAGSAKVSYITATAVSGTERWALSSSPDNRAVSSSTTISESGYYHQYSFQLDYAVSGGGSGYSAPTFTAKQFGSPYTPTLGTSLTTYWLDNAQSWSVTNPLSGSGSNEQWISGQTVLGTVSSSSPATVGGTLTFSYQNQWKVTFSQTGVDSDASSVTVLTVGSNNYAYGSLPSAAWVNSGTSYSWANPVTVSSSEQFTQTGGASGSVATYATISATYQKQWKVTFSQTGVDSSAGSNTVLTVGSIPYAYNALPSSVYLDDGTTFSWTSPVSGGAGKQFVKTGSSGSSPISAAGTYSATYKTQYYVVFRQDGVGDDYSANFITVNGTGHDRNGYSAWTDSGSIYNFAYSSPLVVSANAKQYVLTGVNETTGFTVSGFETVTGAYKTQYWIVFSQTGVGSDFSSTVVTINGTLTYGRTGISFWADNGSPQTFVFASPLTVTASVKQYVLMGANASSPLTVTAAQTVTGSYKTQWNVIFSQTGVSSDFSGTVFTLNGSLPFGRVGTSFWADDGSTQAFVYSSPLTVNAGEQYVLTGVSGNATSSPLTVSGAMTVTGAYKVQWTVTFAQSGLNGADAQGTVVTVFGSSAKTVGQLPNITWVDDGGSVSFSYSAIVSSSVTGKQYVLTGVSGNSTSSSVTVSSAVTVTGNYETQYYLTVVSAHGGPTGAGWYNASITADFGVTSPDGVSGTRYVFTVWSGNSTSTSASDSIVMTGPASVTANWQTQYELTVTSAYGTPSGAGWYNASDKAHAGLDVGTVGTSGTRYVFTSWGTDASGTNYAQSSDITMSSAKTAVAGWKTQYQLTVTSAHDTPTGAGWFDAASTPSIGMTDTTVSGGAGIQFAFTGWSSSDSGGYTGTSASHSVTMNGPIAETASWKTQYLLTIKTSGLPSPYSTSVSVGGISVEDDYGVSTINDASTNGWRKWFDASPSSTDSIGVDSPVGGATGTRCAFNDWTDGPDVNPHATLALTGPVTLTVEYKTQYYVVFRQDGVSGDYSANFITVNGTGHDRNGYSAWTDSGSTYNFTYSSPLLVSANVKQYVLTGVNATSGFTVSAAETVTGSYETEYYVTFTSSGVNAGFSGDVMSIDSVNYTRAGHSGWYDSGASVSFSFYSPLSVNSGKRYVLVSADASSPLNVSSARTVTGTYKTQWYITVDSAHGNPTEASQWVDADSSFNVSVTNPDVVVADEHRWNLTALTVDSAPQTLNNTVNFASVNASHTIVFSWTEQWYLTVDTSPSSVNGPTGQGWYDTGSLAPISTDQHVDIVSGSSRYSFNGWTTSNMTEIADPSSSSTTVLMDEAKTVTANYVTQYNVTFGQTDVGVDFSGDVVNVDGTNYTRAGTSFWWDNASSHSFEFYSPLVVTVDGKRYVWDNTSGLDNVQIDLSFQVTGSGTVSGNYKTQFYLTVNTSPSGIDTPTGEGWYDTGATAHVSTAQYVEIVSGSSRYRFDSWTGASGDYSDATVTMSSAKTVTANYVTQYQITFGQTGVGVDFTGTVVTVDGQDYTVSNLASAVFWWDDASSHDFAFYSPLVVTSDGKQYVWNNTTGLSSAQTDPPFVVSASGSITGNYKTQYYLTVNSDYGSPTGEGWYDEGSSANFGVSSPDSSEAGTRSVFTAWSSSDSGGYSGSEASYSVTMDNPITETASWHTQYYLTVTSAHGSPTGQDWYNASVTADFSVTSPDGTSGTRYVFTAWSGDSTSTSASDSVVMSGPKAVTANWQTQYELTVTSAHGTPSGAGWYNASDTAHAGLDVGTVGTSGTRYVFTSWGSDASGANYAQSDDILMDGPKTATAGWQTQYELTVSSSHGSPTGAGWYNASDTANFNVSSPDGVSGTRYVFTAWSGNSTSTNPRDSIVMTGPASVTAGWQTQYELTVSSAYGTPSGAGWYNASDTAYAGLDVGTVGTSGTRYVFTSWGTDASGSDHAQSDGIVMDAAKTATAGWKTQYQVTFEQTGLDDTATGTVLTVGAMDKTKSDLPYTDWFDDGTTYSYSDPISSSEPGRQFGLTSVNASSPIASSGTISGSYSKVPMTQVPVNPFGPLMSLFSMIAVLGTYGGLRRRKTAAKEKPGKKN